MLRDEAEIIVNRELTASECCASWWRIPGAVAATTVLVSASRLQVRLRCILILDFSDAYQSHHTHFKQKIGQMIDISVYLFAVIFAKADVLCATSEGSYGVGSSLFREDHLRFSPDRRGVVSHPSSRQGR